jgi:hypothetical protein
MLPEVSCRRPDLDQYEILVRCDGILTVDDRLVFVHSRAGLRPYD